jgi:hypothetical protein
LQSPALATSRGLIEEYAGIDGLGINVQADASEGRFLEIFDLMSGLATVDDCDAAVGPIVRAVD